MKTKYLSALFLLLIMAFLAIREGFSEDIHGDFYIFWSAGVNFFQGNALYSRIGGAEEFLYPPFAPMVFQLLAWLPFHWAAAAFSFFNIVGWFGVLFLAQGIIQQYFPQGPALSFSLLKKRFFLRSSHFWWLIFLLTIRYFWHNFIWVNINVLVTLLTFGGILLYLRQKESLALLLLVMATSLKVMPGLLLVVIALHSYPKVWLKMVGIGIGLVLLLLAQRGVGQGIQDFTDYYQIALRPFLNGKVYLDWISLSIPSMLYKLLTAHPSEDIDYHVLNLPLATVKRMATSLQIFIVAAVLWKPVGYFWKNILLNDSPKAALLPTNNLMLTGHFPSLRTWCLAFLAMLLVAGVAWEGHHVTLALVLPASIVLLTNAQMFRIRNGLIIFALIIALMGKDIVGTFFYDLSMEWSFVTFLTVFIFVVLFKTKS